MSARPSCLHGRPTAPGSVSTNTSCHTRPAEAGRKPYGTAPHSIRQFRIQGKRIEWRTLASSALITVHTILSEWRVAPKGWPGQIAGTWH
jgi:hypothetical protein